MTGDSFSHYFTARRPNERRAERTLFVRLCGLELRLRTAAGVFSRHRVDRGTELILEAVQVRPDERTLDLGCGYGVMGIVAARLAPQGWAVLSDINPLAVALARENIALNSADNAWALVADGLEPFADEAFSLILCNPPVRAGWRVVFPMIDGAPRVLRPGGRAFFVARTRQGAPTLQKRLAAAFGNAEIVNRGSGYKVIRAVKE